MPVVTTSRSNNNPFLSSPINNTKTNTSYNNSKQSVPHSASADNINCNVRGNFVIKMKSNTGNNKDSTNNNNINNECISKFEITQTAYRHRQITTNDDDDHNDDDDNLIKTYPSRRKHTDLINQNNENSCQVSATKTKPTKVLNNNDNRVGDETTANNSQSNQINEIDIGAKLVSNSVCLQQLDTEIGSSSSSSRKSAADVKTSVSAATAVGRKGNTNPFINNDNDERKSVVRSGDDDDEDDKKNISHYNNNINVTNDKLDLSHNHIQSENERHNNGGKTAAGTETPNNDDDETLDKKSILHMPDFNDFGKSIDNMSDDDVVGDDDYDDDAYCKSEVIDYVSSSASGRQFSASPTNTKLYHPHSHPHHQSYLDSPKHQQHHQKQVRRVIKDNHYARRGKYDSYNSIARQVVKNKTVSTAVVCQDKKSSMATVLYTTSDTHNQLKSAIPTCSFNRQDYSNQLDDHVDETHGAAIRRDLDTTANSTNVNIAKNMKRINIKRGLVKSMDLFNFSFVSHSHRQQRINSKTRDTCEDKCAINNMKTSSTKTSANMIVAPGSTTNTYGKCKSSSQKQKDIGIYYPASSTSTLINTKRIGRKGMRKNIEKDINGGGGGKYFDKIQARVKIQLDKLEQKCKRIHKSSTHNAENMKHSHTTLGGGQTYDIDDFLSTAVSGTRAKTSSIYLQKYDNTSTPNNKYTDNNDKFCDRPNHNKFLYKSYKSEIDLTKNLTYLDAFLDEKFDVGSANNQNRMVLLQHQDIMQTEAKEHATKNCNYEHRRTKSYTKNNAIVSINQSKDRHHILDVSCEEDSSKMTVTPKVGVMPMIPPSAYTTTSSSLSSSDYASGYSYTGSNEAKEKLILTFDDNPVEYAMPKRNSASNSVKEKKNHLERHKYHDEFYDVDKKETHYMLQQQQHHYSNNHDIYDDDDQTAFSYTNLSIVPPSTTNDIRFDNNFHGDYNDIPATTLNYAHSSVIASNNLSLDESNLMHHYERAVGKRKSNNKMMSRSNSNSVKELTYHENYLEHYSKNKSSKNNLNLSQNSVMCVAGGPQQQQPYSEAITATMTHNLFYDLNAMGAAIGNVNEDNNSTNSNEQNGIKKRKSNNSRNNKVTTTTSLGHHYSHHHHNNSSEYNSSLSNAILQNSAHRMNNDTVSSSTSSYQSTSSGSVGIVSGKSNAQRVIVSKSNNKQVGGGGGELVVEYEC